MAYFGANPVNSAELFTSKKNTQPHSFGISSNFDSAYNYLQHMATIELQNANVFKSPGYTDVSFKISTGEFVYLIGRFREKFVTQNTLRRSSARARHRNVAVMHCKA